MPSKVILERLNMTFGAKGKRQGGPRDQFVPRFLSLLVALCHSQREGRWFHVDEKRE